MVIQTCGKSYKQTSNLEYHRLHVSPLHEEGPVCEKRNLAIQ
jgi:hypothetical protein